MDKRTKAYKEYQRALSVVNYEDLGESGLVTSKQVIEAILLGVATLLNPPKRSARVLNPDAVLFLDTLVEVAGDSVISDPFDASWYNLMERKIRDIPQLDLEAIENVGQYLLDGGWVGNTPTIRQVLYNLATLMTNSKKESGYDPRFG